MKQRLTDNFIAALKYDSARPNYIVWDTETPGFGIRIGSRGKSFVIKYRAPERLQGGRRKQPTMKLGLWGQITIKQARDAAKVHFGVLAKGVDPIAHRRAQEVEHKTVADLCDEYLELDRVKAQKSIADTRRHIKRIRKHIGKMRVVEVNKHTIQAFHGELSKTAPIQANRALITVSAMWNYAISEGYTFGKDLNPVKGVIRNKESARDQRASWDELKAIFQAILTKVGDIHARGYLILTQTTSCRANALRHARWEDFREAERTLTVYVTKNGKPQVLTLTEGEISVINAMPKIAENPYIFAGHRKGKPIGRQNSAWELVREEAGCKHLWIHDGRRKLADHITEAGGDIDIVSRALSHSNTKVTKAHYAHSVPPKVREAKEGYANEVFEKVGFQDIGSLIADP